MAPPLTVQLPLEPAESAKSARQRLNDEKRDQLRAVLYEWVDAGHRMFGDDIMTDIVNHGGKVPYPVTRSHIISIRANDKKLIVTRHKRTPAEDALIARMTGKDIVPPVAIVKAKPLPDDAWVRERDYLRKLAAETMQKVNVLRELADQLALDADYMLKRAGLIERDLHYAAKK